MFNISERNLILTGFIGTETIQIGREIAQRLQYPFVNLETQVAERIDLSVEEIRSYYGESRLKSIESEIVQEAMLRRSTVMYISGRTLVKGTHLANLRTTGPVIYLHISLGAMLQRLHMTMGARFHNPNERALALGELKREWQVRGMESLNEIDATYLSQDEIVHIAVETWREQAIQRA